MMPIISPIQPTSALNMMPVTPSEHIDKNTPAPTPTDQQENKSANASPFMSAAPASVEAPLSVEQAANKHRLDAIAATPGETDSQTGTTCPTEANAKSINPNATAATSNTCNANGRPQSPVSAVNQISNELQQILASLKRPSLTSRDYEEMDLEDELPVRNSLYDYSTMDAWMNHPVKRHRPNEENRPKKTKQMIDLYAAFENKRRLEPTTSETDAASALTDADQAMRSINDEQSTDAVDNYSEVMEPHEIKREPNDSDVDGKATNMENLFTSKGLVASFKDLDQIFDSAVDSPLGVSIISSIHTHHLRKLKM